MKYMEKVHWILDKLGTTIQNQDEHFKENISFVHSLGKKCDSVGWSTLSKDDPKAEEILRKISAFCQEKGWVARGVYHREYTDFDTDWYQIVGTNFPDSAFATAAFKRFLRPCESPCPGRQYDHAVQHQGLPGAYCRSQMQRK